MERDPRDRQDMAGRAPPEREESLWLLLIGPLIWAAHFLLSYVTAAVWCARVVGPGGDLGGDLGGARVLVALYTLVALIGIGLTGWRGFRQHRLGSATAPHDWDTPEDRHRFLGFATLLLCGLSFVGAAYVALAVVFVESCR